MNLQTYKWKIGLKFNDFLFYLRFAKSLTFFAALRAPTTHLYFTKYIFGIVLFAQPFFQSIYGVTVVQMENWPLNC